MNIPPPRNKSSTETRAKQFDLMTPTPCSRTCRRHQVCSDPKEKGAMTSFSRGRKNGTSWTSSSSGSRRSAGCVGGGRYNNGTTECRCLIHARLWGMKIRKYELKFIILVSSTISSTYVRLQSELARPLVTKLASLSISRCLIAIALQ